MTKLEEKLIELGYKKELVYTKEFCTKDNYLIVFIYIVASPHKINDYRVMVASPFSFSKQEHIDLLQLAYNTMQKDLEELKNVKD